MKIRISNPNCRGIALVIVMIAIFVLTILAAGFAYSMKVETRLAQHSYNETDLQWIGRSGVQYAMWILAAQAACREEPYDAESQIWAGGSGSRCSTNGPLAEVQSEIHLEKGSFTWKITDHERKANINTAGQGMLEQALMVVGVDSGSSTPIVSSILDWIDRDDSTHVEGAEKEYYKAQNPPYEAKNGYIDDISELLMIRGIREMPDVYWGAASSNAVMGFWQARQSGFGRSPQPGMGFSGKGLVDLFTPMSSGRVNINTASAEVLQLIPGVDQMTAEAIVAGRQGEDDGSGLMGPYRTVADVRRVVPNLEIVQRIQQVGDVRSRIFDVEIKARAGGSERTYYATVVRNSDRDLAVVSFYWKL